MYEYNCDNHKWSKKALKSEKEREKAVRNDICMWSKKKQQAKKRASDYMIAIESPMYA